MSPPQPKPGDLIEIFRFLHSHWAIYIGNGYVAHLIHPSELTGAGTANSIMSELQGEALVKKALLSDVVGSNNYQVNNKYDDKFLVRRVDKIIQQVEELVGTKVPYRMMSKNSQHFVTHLRYGIICSGQPEPKPGDLIEIHRKLRSHWAIYVGDGYVVHLAHSIVISSVMSGLKIETLVKKELLYVVAGHEKYQINNKDYDKYQMLPFSLIMSQVEELVGKKVPYDIITKNSLHFVKELRYGITWACQPKLKTGDLIEIFRSVYSHWALYVGDGYVIHLTTPNEVSGTGLSSVSTGTADKAIVKKELLYVVAGHDKYRINNKHDDKYPVLPLSEFILKAELMVGKEMPYDLISFNCEHFVNSLRYGIARSDQVVIAMPGLALAAVALPIVAL